MRSQEQINEIVRLLLAEYPEEKCSLQYEKPHELLFAVRLSAQCTDERVNMVTPALYKRFPTLESFAEADVEEVERYVHACGFYRAKARDIVVIGRADSGQRFVLRVVAGPGDTVAVTEGQGLSVNGSVQIETNIFQLTRPYESDVEYPLTLKDDEYFVMADQRNGGMDSRYFGPVCRDEIRGIVITLLRRNNL